MPRESIVVIGFGWVGQANALALARDGYPVSFYDVGAPAEHYAEHHKEHADLYRALRRLNDPLEADGPGTVYIVCVGDRVDEEGNQDIAPIQRALAFLKDARGTVVLRSTVLPAHLTRLDFDIYLPEFVHKRAAVNECVNPQYLVVGKKTADSRIPSFIETWRQRSVKHIECGAEDASYIKYLSNLWNALRIAFVNEFGCSIEEPVDQKAVARIDTILSFIFGDAPYSRYGRSFGGNCLPKDTRAYTRWSEERGRDVSLLRSTLISNEAHKHREEKYPHLPEWFSTWPNGAGSG
ncbi:MAG: hypothetical protein DMD79_03140 [Candidatus Rokuibacteriota bacterium]|nr:MAG: hypothetical protein DMD79_03140 [Candidatus Rokubacteria bacterium]